MRLKPKSTLLVDDWKREKLRDIKVRAVYNALGEEFARAAKKIKAKRKLPSSGLSTTKSKKMRVAQPPSRQF
ncbi:hypothetical protein [Rhizomicrobium electricum]|uniref:Uncharacterized protein n=1 Tax=Rhizomicrobium electricum TaxID=480070 RepID=A0ABP3PK85_9PROT|nr:hypothetical protein [Rhizomicrobium electricum]NIJ48350.1 hypothetical protein [Rhizomicrobium electricum]